MAQETHIIAGKDLDRYWQRHDALLEFHKLFNEQGVVDERAIAIVGATFLDTILEHALMNFMVDDEKETRNCSALIKRWGRFPAA